MSQQQGNKLPAYLRKLLAANAAGKLPAGQVTEVAVYHDDHCALLAKRGPCNCNPDVRLVTRKPVRG